LGVARDIYRSKGLGFKEKGGSRETRSCKKNLLEMEEEAMDRGKFVQGRELFEKRGKNTPSAIAPQKENKEAAVGGQRRSRRRTRKNVSLKSSLIKWT